jgi:hypothetical protein
VLGRVNLVTGHVKTQLIAHDKEVYDIAFSRAGGGRDMFASVGADGSVRMFDLRHLEHSTIIYEDPQHTPLLRLAWNKQDPNYLATVAMDACEVRNSPNLMLIFPNVAYAKIMKLYSTIPLSVFYNFTRSLFSMCECRAHRWLASIITEPV